MLQFFDSATLAALDHLLRQPDPPDLPHRGHVLRWPGEPNRRHTRLPKIVGVWVQLRHQAADGENLYGEEEG